MKFYHGWLVLACLFLTACHSACRPTYTYLPSTGGMIESCIHRCYLRQVDCLRMHDVRRDQCQIHSQEDAFYAYEYDKEQRLARHVCDTEFITSFDYSRERCQHSFRYCLVDYNACYRRCGGVIQENKC